MVLELIATAYALGTVAIMLVGLTFGDSSLGWNYYKGLLFMALVWPYALYRGLRG
jgi:hypothetical protein